MKLKSIVFGANGYIGRHLCSELMNLNHEVLAFDYEEGNDIQCTQFQKVDITDKKEIAKINWNVDFIFHFAGKTGTHVSFKEFESFNKVNIIGLLNVLDQISALEKKPRIIFPSSRLVYKGQKNKYLSESDELEAKTIYAQNKISCESYLSIYANLYNISYSVFRIGVPYGNTLSSEYSYGTIGQFIKSAVSTKKLTIFGSGDQRRTFTHVEDLVKMICHSLNFLAETKNKIYNIGGENYSIYEIANLIASKFNIQPDSIQWPEAAFLLESGDTIFNGTKLNKVINHQNKWSFTDWLEIQNFN